MPLSAHPLANDPAYAHCVRLLVCDKDRLLVWHALIDAVDGDVPAGLLLCAILYWFLPSRRDGQPRVRVYKRGRYWLAKTRQAWRAETRLSPKQVDRALAELVRHDLITVATFRFNNAPTKHVTVNWRTLERRLVELQAGRDDAPSGDMTTAVDLQEGGTETEDREIDQRATSMFPKGQVGCSPKVNHEVDQRGISLTGTTTGTTTGVTTKARGASGASTSTAVFDSPEQSSRPAVSPQASASVDAIHQELLAEWQAAFPAKQMSPSDEAAVGQLARVCHDKAYPVEVLTAEFFQPRYAEGLPGLAVVCPKLAKVIGYELAGLAYLEKTPWETTESDRRLARFLGRWIAAFEEEFAHKCRLTTPDVEVAREFLASDPTAETELVKLARAAWEASRQGRPEGFDRLFACRLARSLQDFVRRLDRIRGELDW